MPSAMTRPWSMTASRSARRSASSRYCVVSSTVVPSAAIWRTRSHTWLRLRGSRPVVGSSRNRISGPGDQAGGDVDAAPHAAREGPHLPAGGVREPERRRAARSPRLRASVQDRPSSRLTSTRFSCPVRSSSTEAYWPVRLTFCRTAAASRDHVVAEHRGPAARRLEQRGEHADRGGLAGAVGAEQAVDGAAADRQVNAVQGPRGAEGLDQAARLDGVRHGGGSVAPRNGVSRPIRSPRPAKRGEG